MPKLQRWNNGLDEYLHRIYVDVMPSPCNLPIQDYLMYVSQRGQIVYGTV